MASKDKEMVDRKVCEKCGLIHEIPAPAGEGRADEWKMIGLSAAGIAAIVLIWVWVFKWGVPLVKKLSGS